MVNIIINEIKDKVDNQEVSEEVTISSNNSSNVDYTGDFEELHTEIKSLEKEVKSLKDSYVSLSKKYVSTLKILQDILSSQIQIKELVESNINKVKPDKSISTFSDKSVGKNKSVSTGKRKKYRKRAKDNDTYEPTKNLKRLWKNLILLDDFKIKNTSPQAYVLPVDLNQLLYVKECDTPKMTHGEYKRLYTSLHVNNGTFGKIIYNIRMGSFDDIIKKYNELVSKTKFSIHPSKDTIRINKVNTNIKKEQARQWIDMIINTSNKEEKILNIQKENQNIEGMYIRIICDSYNNNDLLDCVKADPVEPFIENNPSKRRNLLAQGGLY